MRLLPQRFLTAIKSQPCSIPTIFRLGMEKVTLRADLVRAVCRMLQAHSLVVQPFLTVVHAVLQLPPLEQTVFGVVPGTSLAHLVTWHARFVVLVLDWITNLCV
jgi:hypothetical protein